MFLSALFRSGNAGAFSFGSGVEIGASLFAETPDPSRRDGSGDTRRPISLPCYTSAVASRTQAVAKLVFIDLVGSVAWFPVWWYTTGLQRVIESSVNAIRYRVRSYALRVWIRNFFVPMYGQYDWTGRLISLLMRFVVLVFRIFELAFESALYAAGIILYALAPPVFVALFVMSFIQGAFIEQVTGVIR